MELETLILFPFFRGEGKVHDNGRRLRRLHWMCIGESMSFLQCAFDGRKTDAALEMPCMQAPRAADDAGAHRVHVTKMSQNARRRKVYLITTAAG